MPMTQFFYTLFDSMGPTWQAFSLEHRWRVVGGLCGF
jgi:hypothetical protein